MRVTIGEALSERFDKMTHEIREHVLPALRRQDGFAGALVLVERGSGISKKFACTHVSVAPYENSGTYPPTAVLH